MLTESLPKQGTKIDGVACPVCRKQQAYVYHIGLRENPEGIVYLCGNCRLLYIEPPFDDLREYYRTAYRNTHESTPGKVLDAEERFKISQFLMADSAKHFKENVPKGTSVLEIGCSSGGFISHLVDDYDCYGNEWNPEDAAFVRDVGEIPCEEGDLPDIYPGKTFGAVVANAVIEHVLDPILWLQQIREKMIGGGFLYLETPNANDILVSVYDIPEYKNWWYREPHITYWNADVLASAFTSLGFEARISFFQRYGLKNHHHWLETGTPMDDPIEARETYRPVHLDHPAAAVVNREWVRLDKQYRVMVQALLATDSLRVMARRRDI